MTASTTTHFVVQEGNVTKVEFRGTPDSAWYNALDSEPVDCPNGDDVLTVAQDMNHTLYLWCATCKYRTQMFAVVGDS